MIDLPRVSIPNLLHTVVSVRLTLAAKSPS